MKTNYIFQVIKQFFSDSYSSGLTKKIQHWLSEDKRMDEKDHMMNEIWDSLEQEVDFSTYQALAEIKSRLNMPQDARNGKTENFSVFRILRVAAAIVLPLTVLAGLYLYKNDFFNSDPVMVEIVVPHGERKQVQLPDGSDAWINAGSTIKYAESFKGNTRTVFLSGEAFFAVQKDKSKPFIVQTDLLAVKALGTEFNVEAYPETDIVKATLNSGTIQVSIKQEGEKPSATYILKPNQQLVYNNQKDAILRDISADDVVSWKDGQLIFQDATFNDIIHTLQRYYNITIHIDNYIPSNDYYSVRFESGESIEYVMNILKDMVGNFTYTIKGKEITLRTI